MCRSTLRLMVLFLFITSILSGQILIESTDFTRFSHAVGNYEVSTTGSVLIDLKEEGENKTWNFSNLDIESSIFFDYTIEALELGSDTFFPNANMVMIETEDANPGWELHSYLSVTEDTMKILGKKMVEAEYASQSRHGNGYYYPMPLAYGDFWHSVEYDTIKGNGWSVIEKRTYRNSVDAYGTMQVGGFNFDCLRIRTLTMNGDSTYYGLKYTFVTKSCILLAIAQSQPMDTTDNFSNAVSVTRYAGFTPVLPGRAQKQAPNAFKLVQNYPNPFNPSTTIAFELPQYMHSEIVVYNMKGMKMKTLHSGSLMAGRHEVIWDGNDLQGKPAPSGVYVAQLKSPIFTESIKMLLVK